MVHAWGAYAGDPGDLPEADELNPRGRWEYLPLWDLLAEIGDFAAGATWWAEDFPAQVTVKAADPQLAGRARALVTRTAASGRPMAVEGPGAVSLPRLLAAILARTGLPRHGPPSGRHRRVLEPVPRSQQPPPNIAGVQPAPLAAHDALSAPHDRHRTSRAVRRVRDDDQQPAGPGAAARRIPRPAVRHRQQR